MGHSIEQKKAVDNKRNGIIAYKSIKMRNFATASSKLHTMAHNNCHGFVL